MRPYQLFGDSRDSKSVDERFFRRLVSRVRFRIGGILEITRDSLPE